MGKDRTEVWKGLNLLIEKKGTLGGVMLGYIYVSPISSRTLRGASASCKKKENNGTKWGFPLIDLGLKDVWQGRIHTCVVNDVCYSASVSDVKLALTSCSRSACSMAFRTFFLDVSWASPPSRNSSRMKYAFSKLKMMSSSHTCIA